MNTVYKSITVVATRGVKLRHRFCPQKLTGQSQNSFIEWNETEPQVTPICPLRITVSTNCKRKVGVVGPILNPYFT